LINFSLIKADIDNSQIEGEAEKIQKVVDQVPINEEGNIDPDKLQNFKSQAEIRIQKINETIEAIEWMKYILGVKPEISMRFLLNILMIIVFLVYIRNGFAFSNLSNLTCAIVAFAMTIISIQIKLISNIVDLIIKLVTSCWVYLIIIITLIIIAKIGGFIGKYAEERKKRIAEETVFNMSKKSGVLDKGIQNTNAINIFAKGVTRNLSR
jgi:hypothetical protein